MVRTWVAQKSCEVSRQFSKELDRIFIVGEQTVQSAAVR
jgi:hypothetical protein